MACNQATLDIYDEEFNRYLKLAKTLISQVKRQAGKFRTNYYTQFFCHIIVYYDDGLIMTLLVLLCA